MAYVCESLQLIEGVQTCVSWVIQINLTDSIAINGQQARALYIEFSKLFALFITFAVIAKVAKLL